MATKERGRGTANLGSLDPSSAAGCLSLSQFLEIIRHAALHLEGTRVRSISAKQEMELKQRQLKLNKQKSKIHRSASDWILVPSFCFLLFVFYGDPRIQFRKKWNPTESLPLAQRADGKRSLGQGKHQSN